MSTPASARLIYLSSFEYPSTHAHPLHALSMARAFHATLGDRFLFVVGSGVRDASLGTVPHASPFGTGSSLLKFLRLRTLGYGCWLAWFLLRNAAWRQNLIIFTNDLRLVAITGVVRKLFAFTLVAEIHGSTDSITDALATTFADRLVYVASGLRTRFELHHQDARGKGTLLPNAVDAARFADADGTHIREGLGISSGTIVIGYIGRFRPMTSDKGVDFLIDTLPQDAHLLLVGGTAEEIAAGTIRAQERGIHARVHFVPLIPFDQRYDYFAAADILAYVPPKEDIFLSEETSPMKLYEYMAARRPIIASDLPAFREALGEDAWYIHPGTSSEFIAAVQAAQVPDARIARAFERAVANSWNKRAERILTLA